MSSTSPFPDPAADDPAPKSRPDVPDDPGTGASGSDGTLTDRAPIDDESAAHATGDNRTSTGPDREAAGPEYRIVDVADPSRMRRAPKYGRFGFVGFLLGAAVSLGLTLLPGADDGLSARDLFLLLLLSLGSLGIVLGLVVAMWTDRRSLRKRR